MSGDTHHVDSQSFGSSPNYDTAYYTTPGPMSSSDEMPALLSSSEDEEGGEVKPDSESSDSGSEGSNDRLLSDASCTPDASSASGSAHGPMEQRKKVSRTSAAQPMPRVPDWMTPWVLGQRARMRPK